MNYHIPVLLNKAVEGLNIKPDGIYVDATFGGGGHSKEILKKISEKGRLIVFDQDEDAYINAPTAKEENLFFCNHNFRYLRNFLRYYSSFYVDGIIADLGVSSFQIDNPNRGFSIRFDGPLDFRMNKKTPLTGEYIIHEYSQMALADIFYKYGELHQAKKMAEFIIKERKIRKIKTTGDLKNVLSNCAPRNLENKFFARAFQALRIEVNQEIESLKEFLVQAVEALNPTGRLVVISYHSLEDRIVKNYIKAGNFEGKVQKDFYGNQLHNLKSITGKPIMASQREISDNPRARSAKLRIAEKK